MTDDEHAINRARPDESDEESETYECDDCGMDFEDRDRYERHVEREKRETFRGSDLGDAILDINNRKQGKRLNRRK